MKHFICYDIAADAWRDKASKLLLEHGCKRVQRSVFVAVDFGPRELSRLRQSFHCRIGTHLLPTDSVLCLAVENDLMGDVAWHGENGALESALAPPLTKLV
jgi:CRISPR-associated endonuclease Cas2